MGRVQPRPAWSLAQPSDHGVNYFRNCMKNAMAGGGSLRKKTKRKACLVKREKLLAMFLVVQGRLTCG